MTAPTILRPVPDLATPRVADIDQWREDMRKKADDLRSFRQHRTDALVSQINARTPVKKKRKAAPKPEPKFTRRPTVAPCPGCGRATRADGRHAADFPGTVPRRGGGLCVRCSNGAGDSA